MRKKIWIGVAFGMLACTGAYFAACHAAKHPDGFLGRCANLAGYVGARCGALLSFNQATNCPAKPVAVAPPCDELRVLNLPVEATQEPIEPIIVETIEPTPFPARFESAGLQQLTSVTTLEAKTPFMPYADELKQETVVSPTQAFVDSCWDLLSGLLPTRSASPACPSDCFIRMSVQPFQEFVRALHEETAQEIQVQVIEATSGGQTETNPILPPDLFPQLIVDPHHHQHYPSCPYTGRCPAPAPSFPRLGNVETPRSTPVSPAPRNEAPQDLFSFWFGLLR